MSGFRATLVRPWGWGAPHSTRFIGPKPHLAAGTTGNASGYRGVWQSRYPPHISRWRACISVECRTVHLGTFTDKRAAARAYDAAAIRCHGASAILNFPEDHDEARYADRPLWSAS